MPDAAFIADAAFDAGDAHFCELRAVANLCIDFDEGSVPIAFENGAPVSLSGTTTGDASVLLTDAPGLDEQDSMGLTSLTPAIVTDGGAEAAYLEAPCRRQHA